MIDENQPERQTAKQIEPQFADTGLGKRKENRRRRGGRRRIGGTG